MQRYPSLVLQLAVARQGAWETRLSQPDRNVRMCAAWELVSGEEAHDGLTSIQVMVQVLRHGLRPEIPPDCPVPLAGLMRRCWQEDALLRCAPRIAGSKGSSAALATVGAGAGEQ